MCTKELEDLHTERCGALSVPLKEYKILIYCIIGNVIKAELFTMPL